jgi:hypothetical protein
MVSFLTFIIILAEKWKLKLETRNLKNSLGAGFFEGPHEGPNYRQIVSA